MFTIRTIDQIFQELLLEKQTLTSLNGLVDGGITDENSLISALNTSKVAEWILQLYNMAVQIHLTEIRTNSAIEDIDTIFEQKRVATDKWYIEESLKFQYGDSLTIDPATYQVEYEVIDETKQIIASVTVLDVANKLFLKVRRKNTNILSALEKTAYETFLQNLKIAGTQIVVQNFPGDELTLTLEIIYDGTLDLATITSNVESTINEYIVNLQFDSKFITSEMIDNLQALDGVIDPRFNDGVALDSLAVSTNFTHEYTTNAGWAKINAATPLSTTITYTPR